MPNVVLQVQKNIERKVDIIVATLKEGKRGRAFVWGGQRLLAEIVASCLLGGDPSLHKNMNLLYSENKHYL